LFLEAEALIKILPIAIADSDAVQQIERQRSDAIASQQKSRWGSYDKEKMPVP